MENQNILPERNQFNDLLNLIKTYGFFIFTYTKIILASFLCWIQQLIKNEKIIEDEIVLITGSGGYLGRHLALELSKRNPILILWDINQEQNKKTLDELNSSGFNRAYTYTVDLTNQNEIKTTADKVRSKFGHITMIFMVAAPTFKVKSILEVDYKQDVEIHYKLSYLSQLWMIQEFLQPMININHGHLVTVSSNSALIDFPLISSYASFKLAQTKLLETVREELIYNGIDGVKTTVVYPSILTGGIANGFEDSYEMAQDVFVTGPFAAENIVRGVLKNKDVIYVPKIQWYLSLIKPLFSGRIMGKFVTTKAKLNPKYLKLKPKFE